MKDVLLTKDNLRANIGTTFVGVAVAFICYADGKIFLSRRSQGARDLAGVWDVGAGELEFGHTMHETLVRELEEEYGVQPASTTYIGYLDEPTTTEAGATRQWIVHCFAVKVDARKMKIMEPNKFDALGQYSLDALPEPLHVQFERFMPKYEQKLRDIIGA